MPRGRRKTLSDTKKKMFNSESGEPPYIKKGAEPPDDEAEADVEKAKQPRRGRRKVTIEFGD